MRVPEGFLDFPGGKMWPETLAAYFSPPTDDGVPLTLTVGRLGGHIGSEPLNADDFPPGLIESMKETMRQQAAEITGQDVEVGEPQVEVYQDTWRSRPVSGVLVRMQADAIAIVCRLVVVPLAPEAIRIAVSGNAEKEDEVADTMRAVLDSLDAETAPSRSPLARLPRAVRVEHVAAAAGAVFMLVVVFAAVVLWLARRRARREAGAAAPGIPPVPPTPPLPPPPA